MAVLDPDSPEGQAILGTAPAATPATNTPAPITATPTPTTTPQIIDPDSPEGQAILNTPTQTPSGNGFGMGSSKLPDNSQSQRQVLKNYFSGLKTGAEKFGDMLTANNTPYSTTDNFIPGYSTIKNVIDNTENAVGYLGRAVQAALPFSNRIGAATETAGDLWNGIHSKGVSNLGYDKNGNPINVAGDYSTHLNDINNERTKLANETSPEFYGTVGVVGSAALPMGAFGKLAKSVDTASNLDRVVAGTTLGAVTGGAYGASDTPDWSHVGEGFRNTAVGAGLGALTGATVPAIAGSFGNLVAKGSEFINPSAISDATDPISNSLIGDLASRYKSTVFPETHARIQNIGQNLDPTAPTQLNKLGPEAMPADVSKEALYNTLGASQEPGPIQNETLAKLTQRNANMPSRVNADINSALGPMDDTLRSHAADILDQSKDIGTTKLQPILNASPPVDAKSVIDKIDSALYDANGNEKTVGSNSAFLKKVRGMLYDEGSSGTPPTTKTIQTQYGPITTSSGGSPAVPPSTSVSAEKLNNVRQYISNLANYGDNTVGINTGFEARQNGLIKNIGGAVSDLLKGKNAAGVENVPGYSDAMAQLAPLFKQREAAAFGAESLTNGSHINDFDRDYQRLTTTTDPATGNPTFDQDAANAIKIGQRYQIDRQLGNNPNDAATLKKTLQDYVPPQGVQYDENGPGAGSNSQKIARVFGTEAASALRNTVQRENTFQNTYNTIKGGSDTATRLEAIKSVKEGAPKTTPVLSPSGNESTLGTLFKLGSGAINSLGRVFNPARDPEVYKSQLANFGTSQGQQAQRALAQALRAGQNAPFNRNVGNNTNKFLIQGLLGPAASLGGTGYSTYMNQQNTP